MRASAALFVVYTLLMPAGSSAQLTELQGPLSCAPFENNGLPSYGQPISLGYLVENANEIVYGKFVSVSTKCFPEKTKDGYKIVSKRVVRIDTTSGAVIFSDNKFRIFEFGLDFGSLPQGLAAGDEVLLFLSKAQTVGLYNILGPSSGGFRSSHNLTDRKIWLENGYGNTLLWTKNLWTLVPKEDVRKELSLLKVPEDKVEDLLVLGDESDTRRALPAELLLSAIKVLARNKK